MFAFVHGPSGALHFAAAALSAPSCSGLPPVPRPTNQRTRIFPSEVRPPALDGCAVTSAPDAFAVALAEGDGAAVDDVQPLTTSKAARPSTTRVRQSLRFMCDSTPFQTTDVRLVPPTSGSRRRRLLRPTFRPRSSTPPRYFAGTSPLEARTMS